MRGGESSHLTVWHFAATQSQPSEVRHVALRLALCSYGKTDGWLVSWPCSQHRGHSQRRSVVLMDPGPATGLTMRPVAEPVIHRRLVIGRSSKRWTQKCSLASRLAQAGTRLQRVARRRKVPAEAALADRHGNRQGGSRISCPRDGHLRPRCVFPGPRTWHDDGIHLLASIFRASMQDRSSVEVCLGPWRWPRGILALLGFC